MPLIGILSDTHTYLGKFVYTFFDDCDEIWHAGDIGSLEILQQLQQFKPVRAVYGNIDGQDIRKEIPEQQIFEYNGLNVYLKHIVGYPSHYTKEAVLVFHKNKFDLVVAGHSHILRIMYDKTHRFLFINPGAAGIFGDHRQITLLKVHIDQNIIKDVDIWSKDKQ